MHQGTPDFDLDSSVNDVTTLVQHATPDLAGATRGGGALHRLSVFFSFREGSRKSWISFGVSVGQTLVTKPSMLFEKMGITTDAKGCRLIGTPSENAVIGPATHLQVTLRYGRYCVEIKKILCTVKMLARGWSPAADETDT